MLAHPTSVDIGNSFEEGLARFFDYLPKVLAFLLILLIGYIVAKVVAVVVKKLLDKLGVDRRLHDSQGSRYVDKVMPAGASVSNGISRVVFWVIFVIFLIVAIGTLDIPALTGFINQVLAYLPNVLAAVLIFIVAAILAGGVAGAVGRLMGDTPTGRIVATVVPAFIMVIAVFMILTQLRIAEEIVIISFAAIMGALALGLALAFGLGGRPIAQRLLEDADRAGREHAQQAREDIQAGRARAQEQMQQAQSQVQGDDQYGSSQYGDNQYGEGSYAGGQYGGTAYDQPTQPYDQPAQPYDEPGQPGTGGSSDPRY